MHTEQIQTRTPSAINIAIGFLPNYEIVFNRQSSYRPGGCASIQQSNQGRVYGVIWQLHHTDVAEMDRIERPEAYARIPVTVNAKGCHYRCWAYQAYPMGNHFPPGKEYLRLMMHGGAAHGLPLDYLTDVLEIAHRPISEQ